MSDQEREKAILEPEDRLVFNAMDSTAERRLNRVFLKKETLSASNGYIYVRRKINSNINEVAFTPPKIPRAATMYISSSPDEESLTINHSRGLGETINVPKSSFADLDQKSNKALYNSLVRQSVSDEMGKAKEPFYFALTAEVLKALCECFEPKDILYFAVRSPDEVIEVSSNNKTQGLLMPVKTLSDTWEHVKWLSRDLVMEEMAKTMKGEAK